MLYTFIYFFVSCTHQNTATVAVAKATSNDYVSDPQKLLAQNDTSNVVPTASNEVNDDDSFDPYASLGNLDPTDLVQFAWQIACGMVILINSYLSF